MGFIDRVVSCRDRYDDYRDRVEVRSLGNCDLKKEKIFFFFFRLDHERGYCER